MLVGWLFASLVAGAACSIRSPAIFALSHRPSRSIPPSPISSPGPSALSCARSETGRSLAMQPAAADRRRPSPAAPPCSPAARRCCCSALVGRMYHLQVLQTDRYTAAGRREPHQSAAAAAAARHDPRPLRHAARRSTIRTTGSSSCRAGRRHRDDAGRRSAAIVPLTPTRSSGVLRERTPQARLRAGHGARQSRAGTRSRGSRSPSRPARRQHRGRPEPLLSLRRHHVAHVLGYVGAVVGERARPTIRCSSCPDFRIGKSGIEKVYDTELRGTAGTSEVEVNALGRVMRELDRARRASRAGPGHHARHRAAGIRPAAPGSAAERLRGRARRLHRRRAGAGLEPELRSRRLHRGLSAADWQELSDRSRATR